MLTETETLQLASLLEKLEWPLDSRIFHPLVTKVVTVPIELGVFNAEGKILLIYRNDAEFTGWHVPGTVLRDDGEDVPAAIRRLGNGEVETYISTPIPVGWLESPKDEHSPRHEVALLHVCKLEGLYPGRGQFFDPTSLPDDTLCHHKRIVPAMLAGMKTAGIDFSK